MVTEQGLADKVPGLSPRFSQTCSFSFRVPCEISSEESVLLFHTQTLKPVGAHSTTRDGARMWRGALSAVPPAGKNLKLRAKNQRVDDFYGLFSSKRLEFYSLIPNP